MIQDLLIRNKSEQDGVTHAINVTMDDRWNFHHQRRDLKWPLTAK